MRVLFVCHRFPYPPKRGGKIRPFNIIRHLSIKHEVTVASIVRSEVEASEGRDLARHCAHYEMARVNDGEAPSDPAGFAGRLTRALTKLAA